MKETSKKRLLELHNTKITAEEKIRLSKHMIHSCSLKYWTLIPMIVTEKSHIWQMIKQKLRIW